MSISAAFVIINANYLTSLEEFRNIEQCYPNLPEITDEEILSEIKRMSEQRLPNGELVYEWLKGKVN